MNDTHRDPPNGVPGFSALVPQICPPSNSQLSTSWDLLQGSLPSLPHPSEYAKASIQAYSLLALYPALASLCLPFLSLCSPAAN